ncbi:MAG TPA: polyhydroxyalkanoate depolymerase [Alphaproteobacteria bacterium]|jgi:poly(3-hydroxybutyrate) depolymerase|nr:polyhydroxyalkanoate depolymerase [Alphaproteobacteria bacterium]
MLYHVHELHHAALEPLRFAAQASQQFFQNPFNPLTYTRSGRAVAAACEVFDRTTRRRDKPDFGLTETSIKGESVAVRETVVAETNFCRLLRFERDGCRDQDPRVLIVAPMSGHFATLLRDTVAALLPNHDIHITDWRDARDVPAELGDFDLDDYIDTLIDFLHRLGPPCHVIAVCQPSVPVLAATALMAAAGDSAAPCTMTLMGGPIDTRESPTEVNNLAKTRSLKWFERNVITRVPVIYPGFMRPVYPGFLQLTGFMTMNLDRHLGAHVRLFHHLVEGDGDGAEAHRHFYDEYLAVMDLPAEYYLQTIETVFQDHALPLGTMTSRGRPIEPAAITGTALMTVEGERDDISGLGQTAAAHKLCSSLKQRQRLHHEEPGVGHYGVFNGRKWRRNIAPRIARFIRRHEGT